MDSFSPFGIFVTIPMIEHDSMLQSGTSGSALHIGRYCMREVQHTDVQ